MVDPNLAIECRDIHTYYGDSYIIQGLSLFVANGEVVTILGRNGVGKTTTIRSIMGLTPPRYGHVFIDGEETTHWPTHRIVKKGVCYVPSERQIIPGLSVDKNLKLAERTFPDRNTWNTQRVFDYFPVLSERRGQDGSTLSGGEQQMLAIGRGLMGNPRIMLLDEPSIGLAPVLVFTVVDIIKDLIEKERLSLLLVEQNYRIGLSIGRRHYLMVDKGKIAQVATTEQLLEDEGIIVKHLSV